MRSLGLAVLLLVACSPTSDLRSGGGGGGGGGDATVGGGAPSGGGGAAGGDASTGGGSALGGGTAAGGGSAAGGGGSGPCTEGESCTPATGGLGICCAGSQCIGFEFDRDNCGGCGIRCPTGASCSGAVCSTDCTSAGCPAGTGCIYEFGYSACFPKSCAGSLEYGACASSDGRRGQCCGGTCAAINSDDQNCGACGDVCGAGQFCSFGTCETKADCALGEAGLCLVADGGAGTCCGGACGTFDFQNDRENCGTCGGHCALGAMCVSGRCQRPDSGFFAGCSGNTECAPPLVCAVHDGWCETATCGPSNAGQTCAGGTGKDRCCGNRCADLYADHDNCGACGHACGANAFCDNGACKPTPTCGPANSGVDCPNPDGGLSTCCDGACADVTTDVTHCGACGARCPAGRVCLKGACTLPDAGYLPCTDLCPAGTVCDNARCLPVACETGGSGASCAFGTGYGSQGYAVIAGRCCGGACVDLGQDPHNCGMCGAACSSGPQLCEPGFFSGALGGACLPALSSGCLNCPAGSLCINNSCQSATCNSVSGGVCQAASGGVGTCCPQGFSTTCRDVTSDPQNCGACGVSCNGGTCSNGVCSTTPAACAKGHSGQYCNLDAGTQFACCPGSGCVDTSADPKNCRRCGAACAAGLSCVDSQCLVLSCTPSLQNLQCEDDAGTIGVCCGTACANRSNDRLNCGSCGHKCVGAETCVGGNCGLDVCDVSSVGSACHADGGAGGLCCAAGCTDTGSDVNNCGGCNRHCAADAGCVQGNCQ